MRHPETAEAAQPYRPPAGLWLLLLATVVIYIPAMWQPFFLDDYVYLDKAAHINLHKAVDILTSPTMDQSASGVWWVPMGTLPFYRPVGLLAFAADWLLWGLHPFGYHLTNVLLHVICVALTWRLARRLFTQATYALTAAAVFAVYPVHNEAVTWVSGRFDLLVCACILASVVSYLNWSDGRGWGWMALSALWFVVGLGCKETALILPAMVLAIQILREPGRPARTRQIVVAMAWLASIAILYLAWRITLFGSPFGRLPAPYGLDMTHPLRATGNVAWYLCLYLMNLVLCINADAAYLSQFWSRHPLLLVMGLSVCVLALAAAIRVARSRVAGTGLVWLGLFTAPSLLSMPGERNVYLASVGLALLLAAAYRALAASGHTRPTVTKLAVAVAGVWVVLLIAQQVLIGCVASASQKVYRDLQVILPNPPAGARIYVVNQSPLASVGFAQAIRLYYGRADLSGCALSLSPTLGFSSQDQIVPLRKDSIRLVREGGLFFSSFIERFHRFSDPASTLAQAAQRWQLELIAPPATYDNVQSLEFRFPYSLDDPRLQILCWDNHRVLGIFDLLHSGSLTELTRCRPVVAAAHRAGEVAP